MMRLLALTLGATVLLAPAAKALDPPQLSVELQQKLDASPDEVWAAIGRFDDLSWLPPVARVELTGDGSTDRPDQSTRVLHLKAKAGDPTITEVLTKWQPEERCHSYRIEKVEVSVLPVTDYVSTLCVKDADGKALVIWRGEFHRGHRGDAPPAGQDDAAAIKAVTWVYQTGLDALAARFGHAR